jgi:Kdo2-lipid IVA lauroyltransferase/acyltransferase
MAFYVLYYRKRVVLENLRRVFPEKPLEDLKKIRKKFFHHLSDLVVETLKGLSISKEVLTTRMDCGNLEVITELLIQKKSVIILTAHYGNWEWLLQSTSIRLSEFGLVDGVYKPLRSKFSDHLMAQIRSRFGADAVPMNNILREVLRRDKETISSIALVADQRPQLNEKVQWIQFLNQETPFFVGAERLAVKTQLPVVFTGMRKIKRGHYQVFHQQIGFPPYVKNEDPKIIETYAKLLENEICAEPAYWLWSHKRWKLQKSL